VSQQRDTASAVIDDSAWPDVLASDSDRDTTAGRLSSAFAEGRLTAAEHAERAWAAYGARTRGELAGLTADLPGPADDAGRRQAPFVPDEVDRCRLCALLICCPPAGIAWLLAARRRARASGGARAADR
jgi:Domain of unknown function (DUF1707)